MRRVIRELERRGIDLSRVRALDVFAGAGRLASAYGPRVDTVEFWEIDPHWKAVLRERWPNATVRTIDSFVEVSRTPRAQYDLIVVDSDVFSSGGTHFEHFDLFPDVLRLAADEALLLLTVMEEIDSGLWRRIPDRDRYLAERAAFYRTHDPVVVPLDHMGEQYRRLCRREGFVVRWTFAVRRGPTARFLVLAVRRVGPAATDEAVVQEPRQHADTMSFAAPWPSG